MYQSDSKFFLVPFFAVIAAAGWQEIAAFVVRVAGHFVGA